jgi:hypothetical protein
MGVQLHRALWPMLCAREVQSGFMWVVAGWVGWGGVEQGGGRGLGVALRACPSRCSGCPALRGLGPRRKTPCVRCAHCGQTAAASQKWKRAGTRAGPSPVLLGFAQSRATQAPATALPARLGLLDRATSPLATRPRCRAKPAPTQHARQGAASPLGAPPKSQKHFRP